MNSLSAELFNFIEKSPTAFHLVDNVARELSAAGFSEISEKEDWNLVRGNSYFVRRNNSSIISFRIPEQEHKGFLVAASHSDSPAFKIKENPEMKGGGAVTKLNIEKYGGMLCNPWFDRPLGIAGRIFVREDGSVKEKLFDFGRNICLIPNLAIHMNREANEKNDCNVQNRMLPVFSIDSGASLLQAVADKAGCKKEDVLGHDLFVYNRDKGFFWGKDEEFISSPRLDDAECAFCSTKAFIAAGNNSSFITMNCIFDNEEVGSGTRQGADGTFFHDALTRISESLGDSRSTMLRKIACSFLISCDNAHAVHPSFEEKSDPVNRPVLNKGPVVKFNAAQKYCTDGYSAAVFKDLCIRAGVPFQVYTNRSDLGGGSTLGNISQSHVSIPSVDIGIAQWAMHSPMESGGAEDCSNFEKVIEKFFGES